MAAHHDEVGIEFGGQGVDFDFRPPHNQVAVFRVDAVGRAEALQLLAGLLVNLVLDTGEVHGNVAAVGKAQGFDDVDQVQLGGGAAGDSASPLEDHRGILAQVYGNEDFLVVGHVGTPHRVKITGAVIA